MHEKVWLSPRRLLIAAALFHIIVTASIYGVGRYAVFPGMFDENGIAVSFAPDGIEFREETATLSEGLARGQIRDWLAARAPLHVKLYSPSFVLLGRLFGPGILSAEPINLLCYLAILSLVFRLGQEVFNRRAGLIAAAAVALWPSFLLHTTQLLKDPLFVMGMLAFIFVNVRFLSRSLSLRQALLSAACGGLIALFTWLARGSMGELLIGTVALAGVMLVLRQFWERRVQAGSSTRANGGKLQLANLLGMTLLIVLSVAVTRLVPQYQNPKPPFGPLETSPHTNSFVTPLNGGPTTEYVRSLETSQNPLARLAARLGKLRQQFVLEFPASTSNIDSNVKLTSVMDVIRYLPRAAVIGFSAPFPNMWLATGSEVGRVGRLISGLETIAMYVVEAFAIVGIYSGARGARRFSVWFLWWVAAMGLISLGLVVVNVGALYRLRYVFLILLIILGAQGAARTMDWWTQKRAGRSGGAAWARV
jgi:hypothetical protein